MKSIFDTLSLECSRMTTRRYSTSFSLGIFFLHQHLRDSICSIYGFVRFADEIVDSFHGYDQRRLFYKFRLDTFEAIEEGISLNPVLNSFQKVVNEYEIPHELIHTFLRSMEMDLKRRAYSKAGYDEYILGSAEVVGLMCLQVFANKDKQIYETLKPAAMKLGAAFQKVNFLRDIQADYKVLGRTYFPGIDLNNFTQHAKDLIEKEIESDFKEGLAGIKKLPASSRGGVYLAYVYYRSLFKKIKRIPVQRVMTERIRISNGHKLGLMCKSMFEYKTNLL